MLLRNNNRFISPSFFVNFLLTAGLRLLRTGVNRYPEHADVAIVEIAIVVNYATRGKQQRASTACFRNFWNQDVPYIKFPSHFYHLPSTSSFWNFYQHHKQTFLCKFLFLRVQQKRGLERQRLKIITNILSWIFYIFPTCCGAAFLHLSILSKCIKIQSVYNTVPEVYLR